MTQTTERAGQLTCGVLVLRCGRRRRLFPGRKNRPGTLHSPLHATALGFTLGTRNAKTPVGQIFQVHAIEGEAG